MSFVFYTTCVDVDSVGSYGECINEMTQSPHAVSLDSNDFCVIAEEKGFLEAVIQVLVMKDKEQFVRDFGVECYHSHFQGIECYYVRFSGIEHVFVDASRLSELRIGQELIDRCELIEELAEKLDGLDDWSKAEGVEQEKLALFTFIESNEDVMRKNNILTASLFDYGHDYGDIVKYVDAQVFGVDISPCEAPQSEPDVYGSDWPIGSVIEMYEERLRILANYGSRGEVEAMDGRFVSARYYWEYMGEKAKLISRPSA